MKRHIAIISGGFDPVHSGHIDLFKEAALLGDVIVILNSNSWLVRKKGRSFMSYAERSAIVGNFKNVIDVVHVDDKDNTVVEGLAYVAKSYPTKNHDLTFLNGGDRQNENVPEVDFCEANNISLKFNVGGKKHQSSSELLANWREAVTKRKWGSWSVLKEYDGNNVKVKELVVHPGQRLSYQRHFKRSEFWFVAAGTGEVTVVRSNIRGINNYKLNKYDTLILNIGDWHQLINNGTEELHIIEIQWGEECVEEDITREDNLRAKSL